MKRGKIGKFTAAGFVILILLVVFILMSNSLRRSSHIVLPDTTQAMEILPGSGGAKDEAITPVTVTPQTVHSAIESLRRPESYRRIITVERLWDGGSGAGEVTVAVAGGWTRTDAAAAGGRIRHSLTDGETTYIWYGTEREVYQTAAGDVSADQEQGILTYEDILELPAEEIEAADYRDLSGVNCIYVAAKEDESGRATRYWVSVDTGLLAAAERLKDGASIYRMGAPTLDAAGPAAADFTLPDGTVVAQIG